MRFVAVGELLVDVLVTGHGHGARVRMRPGGSSFNAAVAAASAGGEATVVGTVGDDPAGRMLRSELRRRGVRDEVSVEPGPTGTFVLADDGVRVDRGVSGELTLPATIEADVVLVSGYLPVAIAEAALQCARAAWVALDAARLQDLPKGGNVLVANEDTARRLTGDEAEQAVRALSDRYRLVCVTRGERGAVAALDGRFERAAMPPIDGSAPGAGDAFAAVTLVALAGGASLAEALAEGCRHGRAAAADG
jgi:sugar/nucleoside kinase (ribokinase family)